MRRPALAVVVVLLAGVLGACSDPVWFFVVDDTSRALTVLPFHEKCGSGLGYRQDYENEAIALPGSSFEYYDSWGGSDTKCVRILDAERRLVYEAPYEYGAMYTVTGVHQPVGDPLPAVEDLPSQPWLDGIVEEVREKPASAAFLAIQILVSLVFLIALPYGIYRAVKDLRRYRKSTS